MKNIFLLIALLWFGTLAAQPVQVVKTNPQKVYMHYMPWFDSPQTSANSRWGLHWTMANRNPNIIDPVTGQRQIASWFYPLIGPYACSDTNVIEYHLLLMKYAGVDGVLFDFYGNGSNDLPLILRNTNAIVPRTDNVGLGFGVVFEDQFASTLALATANMQYVGTNYFSKPNYIQVKNKPLVMTFGPQLYQTPADWTTILGALPTRPTFLTLWYESQEAGVNANGEFSWIYSDYLTGLRNFYNTRANTQDTVGGVAYPGFKTYYAQGGWGGPTFTISHDSGRTLNATLNLATQFQNKLAFVQLATFNDFGEGTQFEPTKEFGYSALERVQTFTGVPYTVTELRLIHQLYTLRLFHAGNAAAQATLNQAFQLLIALDVPGATVLINSLQQPASTQPTKVDKRLNLYPNPAGSMLKLDSDLDLRGGTFEIIDASGRVLMALDSKPNIDISTLAVGTYRLVYRHGAETLSQTFVK